MKLIDRQLQEEMDRIKREMERMNTKLKQMLRKNERLRIVKKL